MTMAYGIHLAVRIDVYFDSDMGAAKVKEL
jgi:hypothetical protein